MMLNVWMWMDGYDDESEDKFGSCKMVENINVQWGTFK
uniref:Uncharacterized protein n=1 Tax=Melanopsichium pennsylvanicum 4 TaxID=1398559 RepID=A0A077R174_9BASI|nr:uncharacterized protein BN887_06072 [Melanopsichium pennsylvanicum 4]